VEALDLRDFPVHWEDLPAIQTIDRALAPDASASIPAGKQTSWCRGESSAEMSSKL
jgi:hypothetical protein